jgi:hypothetical protein
MKKKYHSHKMGNANSKGDNNITIIWHFNIKSDFLEYADGTGTITKENDVNRYAHSNCLKINIKNQRIETEHQQPSANH